MGTLRIDGKPPCELPREAYDLGRKNLLDPKAVCHAPFGSLHVGARLGPCRHGTADLGDAGTTTLTQAFSGGAADGLRDRFRRYEVRRDECARCVHHWEDRAAAESPAQREFDHELPPLNGMPPRLSSLSLDLRVLLPEARLAEARTLLPQLDRVTLICGTLAKNSVAARFAADVDAIRRDPRPRLRLLASGFVPGAGEIPPSTAAVEIGLPIAPLAAADAERLADLADELAERRTTLIVCGELGRSNWAGLRAFFSTVRACGAAVAIAPLPKDHPDSLAALDADLLAVLHGIVWRFGAETAVAGDERHGGAELRELLHRLREWQRVAADRPSPGAALDLPPLDQPLLADEGVTRRLLEDLLRTYHHPQVGAWLGRLVQAPAFAAAAPARLSLRLALLWLIVVFDQRDLDATLRALYRDAGAAAEQIAADRAVLQGTPLANWHDGWVRALGLEVKPRGAAPFPPATAPSTASGRAQVTIVIPSYNHERFVGQAIDSALAQAGPQVRVLVVDDASTDATVKIARLRKDPRLVVARNPRNIGLGESLRRALKRVRTTYVAILNSDDFFHPQRIERLLAALEQRPRAAVAASLVIPVDAQGRTLTGADASPVFDGKRVHDWLRWFESSATPPEPGADLLGSLFDRNWLVSSSNLLCRRDWLLEHAHLWRDLDYCVDWQVFLAAAAQGVLQVVREPLLGYRLHTSNTVWFDEERAWRFYVESHRVVARALEERLAGDHGDARARFDALLELITHHVAANRDLDFAGIWLGLLLERLKIPSQELRRGKSAELLQVLDKIRRSRVTAADVAAAIGDDLAGTLRDRGEATWLRNERQHAEALSGEVAQLQSELHSALADRRNFERLWHTAERERDTELAGKTEIYQRIGALDGAIDAARSDAAYRAKMLAQREREAQDKTADVQNLDRLWHQAERERDAEIAGKADLYQRIATLDAAVEKAQTESGLRAELLAQRERDAKDKTAELEQLRAMRAELHGSLESLQHEHERVRLDIEEAMILLRTDQRSARGSLANALESMGRGDAFARGELGQALVHVQQERERVESGLSDVLTRSIRDRDETRVAADREREILVGALDRLHERVAELDAEVARTHRLLIDERLSAVATLETERAQAAASAEARHAELRSQHAESLAHERAAAKMRFAALLAQEALARAEIEEQAQRERTAADRQAQQALAAAEQKAQRERTAADRQAQQALAAAEQQTQQARAEVTAQLERTHEQSAAAAALAERLARVEASLEQQKKLTQQRTWERDDLKRQPEWRVGDLALNKLPLKKPLRFVEKKLSKQKSAWATSKLRAERCGWLGLKGRSERPRVFSTICWNFPIYSQTFVYQELMQLKNRGFDLRVIYSKLDPRDRLAHQFAPLWDLKRPMHLDRPIHEADHRHYQKRFPDRVLRLTERLAAASGLSREQLERHDNYLQGFTYARLAEAWGADYLHSYFFYDRSLMSLIAGEVLNLPHGVSCYADHVMKDYELKVVPLHLETCDVVIATSHRIKRELLEIAPATPPDKILVKPNAVDCTRFPVIPRPEPGTGQPHRVVVTARIEPKKGLIYLVEAIRLLRDRGVNVEAHFVGDCDQGVPASENYKAELCALIERHQLWGTIHLEGRQPEQRVRHFLAIAHLFVAPFVETESGDKDGIPTALIEAMATGIPSVVTDSGSILEVVDDKVDARVVPQRDPQALADAISELLRDPRGRKFMAQKAAQKAREKFDTSICDPWFHERVSAALAARRKA